MFLDFVVLERSNAPSNGSGVVCSNSIGLYEFDLSPGKTRSRVKNLIKESGIENLGKVVGGRGKPLKK